MRKISSLFLIALLALTMSTGAVAAKPKDDNPGQGAVTVKIRESGTNDRVGAWTCSGMFVKNKNHTRVHVNCTIEIVGPYAGTYTNTTPGVPDWLAESGSAYLPKALELTEPTEGGLEAMQWQVVVKPNGDGSGRVEAIALLD